METTVIARRFGQAEMHIVQDEHGDGWVPGEEIGKALEYASPRKRIDSLFQKNKDILGAPEYSGVLSLRTPGGIQETRCYSEQGVYLLLMYSRQPKAREFQKWVAMVLVGMRKEYIASLDAKIAEGDRKLAQMEKALAPDQKKLLDEYWDVEYRAWKAEKDNERLKEENRRLWSVNEYPRQPEHYQWAQILRIARECNLNLKDVSWTPGRRVLKFAFYVKKY